MKHFATTAAAQSLSLRSYSAKMAAGLKSVITLSGPALTILFCTALSLTPTPAEADTICFLRVLKAFQSSHADPEYLVINDNAQWQSLWQTLFSNRGDKPPLPEIDFTNRTIVAVFQGTQSSSGYEILIEEIVETENSLEVAVKAFAPGRKCGVLGTLTRPFDIVEIEKTEKQVVFHVKQKVRNCG